MKRTTLFDEMNRLFDEMRHATGEGRFEAGYRTPGVPIRTETDEEGYLVHADLPGFERSEIDLRFDEGVLSIDATHERGEESERWSRSVHEELRIPGDVDAEGIEASYHNGVLEIRLPAENADEDGGHRIEID